MKEALKLALEVLQWSKPHKDAVITHSEAITAINAALAQQDGQSNFCAQCEAFARELKAVKQEQVKPAHVISEKEQLKNSIAMTDYYRAKREYEPWCMKMNGCKTKCEDCPDEPAQEKT